MIGKVTGIAGVFADSLHEEELRLMASFDRCKTSI